MNLLNGHLTRGENPLTISLIGWKMARNKHNGRGREATCGNFTTKLNEIINENL